MYSTVAIIRVNVRYRYKKYIQNDAAQFSVTLHPAVSFITFLYENGVMQYCKHIAAPHDTCRDFVLISWVVNKQYKYTCHCSRIHCQNGSESILLLTMMQQACKTAGRERVISLRWRPLLSMWYSSTVQEEAFCTCTCMWDIRYAGGKQKKLPEWNKWTIPKVAIYFLEDDYNNTDLALTVVQYSLYLLKGKGFTL